MKIKTRLLAVVFGIVIFSGQDMDISDVDTKYFLIFPGKKQFIKRLVGKPGDSLYFYGGLIYGIDKDGNDLPILRDSKWFKQIDERDLLQVRDARVRSLGVG